MPILNVCNLCKTYLSGEAEVKALDHVSFTVEKGEFISIIGPSGSGKSTLLHILAGIDRPTSGKVTVDGEDIYAKNEKELAYYRQAKGGLDLSILQSCSHIDSRGEHNASIPS